MNIIDYSTIDLNLLRVFDLLMRERSLTETARRLSVGQPAVSHALARLRATFDDPLLVRAGRTMEPTGRALALHDGISPVLDQLATALNAAIPFQPETDARTFRIGLSDDLQVAFLPRIMARLRTAMPKARLVIQQTDYRQAAAMLERKQATLVAGYLDKLPAAAKVRKIRRVGYRMVSARPARAVKTLDQYCACPHALVTFAGDLVGYIDETLDKQGRARSVALSLSGFALLASVLAETDYLATVPAYLADRLAENPGLNAVDLPFPSPEFDVSMAWPASVHEDPAEKLLRGIVVDVINETE